MLRVWGVVIGFSLALPGLVQGAETDPNVDAGLFGRLDTSADGALTADEVAAEKQGLVKRLLRRGDANHDGQLSADEFAVAMQSDRPDKPITEKGDSDGPGLKAARLVLLSMDTSGDARIEREEVPEQFAAAFDALIRQIDDNENDTLDQFELSRGTPQVVRASVQTVMRLRLDLERELAAIEKKQGDKAKRFDEPANPREVLADPRRAGELFDRLDSNKDGKVELDEIPPQAPGNFGRMIEMADRNGDKALSRDEFTAATKRLARIAGGGSPPPEMAETMQPDGSMEKSAVGNDENRVAANLVAGIVKRLDSNGDGALSSSEIQGRMADRIKRADTDGDGTVDAGEIAVMQEVLAERLGSASPDERSRLRERLRGQAKPN